MLAKGEWRKFRVAQRRLYESLSLFFQMLPGPGGPRLECSGGDAERSAGFRAGQFLVIGHCKCLPEDGSHFSEQDVNEMDDFLIGANHFRIGLHGWNQLRPRSVLVAAG